MSAAKHVDMTPSAGAGLFTVEVDQDVLSEFEMSELLKLGQGLRTLADVADGLLCQPKFAGHESGLLNTPGDALELVSDLLNRLLDDVEREAISRNPKGMSPNSQEMRGWIIIQGHSMRLDTMSVVRDVANALAEGEEE